MIEFTGELPKNFDIDNNYLIVFDFKGGENLEHYALSVDLVGMGLNFTKKKNHRNGYEHIIVDTILNFENITIPFILDNKWNIMKFLYKYFAENLIDMSSLKHRISEDANRFNLVVFKMDNVSKKPLIKITYHNTIFASYSRINRTSLIQDVVYKTVDVEFIYEYFTMDFL